MKFVIYIIL